MIYMTFALVSRKVKFFTGFKVKNKKKIQKQSKFVEIIKNSIGDVIVGQNELIDKIIEFHSSSKPKNEIKDDQNVKKTSKRVKSLKK